jgi:hypothetical protein
MSNLRPQVQSAITKFFRSQDGHHIASDVLRIIEEEAGLMKETEEIKDSLDRDPMEQLKDVKRQVQRLQSLIRVTSCNRVRTRYFIGVNAVVDIQNSNNLQLTFKYEQKPRHGSKGSNVWYSIEMSQNHGERENLLVVQVWAPNDAPCTTSPAVCINQEEGDAWEDIDEDDEDAEVMEAEKALHVASDDCLPPSPKFYKKPKIDSTPENQTREYVDKDEDSKEETHDSFTAYMDPELLHTFLESAGLLPMDEGTGFFLLMTFPFYEHEWDLVGYVLDEVFGAGDDDEDMEDD